MNRLAFGYNEALPEGVAAAWGARLIWPNDLLYNRQDSFGEAADWQALQNWLSKGPLKAALEGAADKLREAGLTSSMNGEVVLYEDKNGKIVGHPKSSCGYLYIAAWLYKHEAAPVG